MDKITEKDLEYYINYRNIKYPRLEFKTGKLLLIIPQSQRNEKNLIEKHATWIQKKEMAINDALKEASKLHLNNRNENDFKSLVRLTEAKYQTELDVKIGRTVFKTMRTKWASYSPNHNVTVNTLMRYLPEKLLNYVLYHEIAHGIEKRHNERFWKIIQKQYPDHDYYEEELFSYWFLIQNLLHHEA